MPYIVTPGIQTTDSGTNHDAIAVATIDEARVNAWDQISRHGYFGPQDQPKIIAELDGLNEQGGTIGPMPDGFMIDVQKVSPLKMAALSGGRVTGQMLLDCLRVDDFSPAYDAFNDR